MGTRDNPGRFDCYAKAEPDEQLFTLMARDPDFEEFVRWWAHWRSRQIEAGVRPATEEEFAQIKEAQEIATEGGIWGRAYRQRQEHLATEFGPASPSDGSRVPLHGQHARLERNSTSGANDKA